MEKAGLHPGWVGGSSQGHMKTTTTTHAHIYTYWWVADAIEPNVHVFGNPLLYPSAIHFQSHFHPTLRATATQSDSRARRTNKSFFIEENNNTYPYFGSFRAFFFSPIRSTASPLHWEMLDPPVQVYSRCRTNPSHIYSSRCEHIGAWLWCWGAEVFIYRHLLAGLTAGALQLPHSDNQAPQGFKYCNSCLICVSINIYAYISVLSLPWEVICLCFSPSSHSVLSYSLCSSVRRRSSPPGNDCAS